MDVEELKRKTILVQYIYNDIPPTEGLRRMQYFTSFEENPDIFYLGLSIRKSSQYGKETLEEWVKEGQLVKLTEPAIMPYKDDVWLDEKGNILLALGYAPWKGEKKVIGSLK